MDNFRVFTGEDAGGGVTEMDLKRLWLIADNANLGNLPFERFDALFGPNRASKPCFASFGSPAEVPASWPWLSCGLPLP